MIDALAQWLSTTTLHEIFSDTNHTATWLIIPVSQSIHILAVAALMMSVLLLNFRLLGLAGTRQSFAQLSGQLMPWVWPSLAVLLLTGTVQTIAEPMRELLSTTFWLKMAMLMVTLAITVLYARTVRSDPSYWERSRRRRATVKTLAISSLVLWVGIVAAGRLIAYL
jgi:hypothetical protein